MLKPYIPTGDIHLRVNRCHFNISVNITDSIDVHVYKVYMQEFQYLYIYVYVYIYSFCAHGTTQHEFTKQAMLE